MPLQDLCTQQMNTNDQCCVCVCHDKRPYGILSQLEHISHLLQFIAASSMSITFETGHGQPTVRSPGRVPKNEGIQKPFAGYVSEKITIWILEVGKVQERSF